MWINTAPLFEAFITEGPYQKSAARSGIAEAVITMVERLQSEEQHGEYVAASLYRLLGDHSRYPLEYATPARLRFLASTSLSGAFQVINYLHDLFERDHLALMSLDLDCAADTGAQCVANLLEISGNFLLPAHFWPAFTSLLCRAILQVPTAQRTEKKLPEKAVKFSTHVLRRLNRRHRPPWKPTDADKVTASKCLPYFYSLNNDIPGFIPVELVERMQGLAQVPEAQASA